MPPYKYGGVASLNKVSSLFNGSFPSHCYQLIAHRGGHLIVGGLSIIVGC